MTFRPGKVSSGESGKTEEEQNEEEDQRKGKEEVEGGVA